MKPILRRERNAVKARIESAIEKYGIVVVRQVWNRYLADLREEEKLTAEIKEKEQGLANLKKRRK